MSTHKFQQARVWRWLRKQKAPASRRDMAKALKLTEMAVSHILRRLSDGGFASGTGRTWARRWSALGDKCPEDLRGTAPGTLAVLAATTRAQRGPGSHRRAARPKPGTEIERCWGWLP